MGPLFVEYVSEHQVARVQFPATYMPLMIAPERLVV